MSANLFQRAYTVAIGGKDFSPGVGLCQLTQDKQTSSGYVTVQGSLEIIDWLGLDESLDPQLNLVRWQVGQTVDIRVADSAGVLQPLPWGMLYIRGAAPSANYRSIELEIGDWLAIEEWRSTESPNEDVPEAGDVTVASYARQTLITELLTHVEMVPGDVVAGNWIGDRVEDLQGGYIDMCGGLAFGAETPGILWGQGKVARVTTIDPAPAAPWLQVTLGRDEALYEPQTAEFPVETYICTAEGYEDADGDYEIDGDGCVVRSELSATVREVSSYCVDPVNRTVQERQLLDEPEVSIDPDGGTGLVRSVEKLSIKSYDLATGRLEQIVTRVNRPRIAVFAEAAEEQGIELVDPWLEVQAERETTSYTYDETTGVIRSIIREKEEVQGNLAPKYSAPANWSTRNDSERSVESWFKSPGGEWIHQKRDFQSLIRVSPQLVERRDEQGGYDMLAIATNLTAVAKGGLSGSTSGQSQPPGIEYFPDTTDGGYRERTLEGRATFEPLPGALRRARETEESIPFASTENALKAAANIGGVFRLGRYRGRSLKVPIPDKFFSSYEPLRRVDVVEPGAVKTFLGDGCVLLLDRTESSLYFPHLIWLGTAPAQGITSTGGGVLAIPNPSQFEVGQAVEFSPAPSGGLPAGLEVGTPYYVVGTAGGLQVSESPGGSPVAVGPLPLVNPSVVLPSPDPVTGALGSPAPAYGGAPFVVVPASPTSDPRLPQPIQPPYVTPIPGFAEVIARAVAGQAPTMRQSVAIAQQGVEVGQDIDTAKTGVTASGGVEVGQALTTRQPRAIAQDGVEVGQSISRGGPGLAEGGVIVGQSAETRKPLSRGDGGVLAGQSLESRRSSAQTGGGVLAGQALTTRPSGYTVGGGVLVGQEAEAPNGVPLDLLLGMAHARGLTTTATDAMRVTFRSRSLLGAISKLDKE